MTMEDEMAATKAEERRARLAHMMVDASSESQQQPDTKPPPAQQPGAFPVASITLRQNERALERKGVTSSSLAGTAIPSALSNLESKLDDRRGQVSRMMNGNGMNASTTKAATSGTNSAKTDLPAASRHALANHERDLLAKTGGGVESKTQNNNNNNNNNNNIMVHALQGAFNQVAPENDEEKPALPYHHPNQPHLKAEIVDDTKEREQITREAQQMLISQAVVATSVEKTASSKRSLCMVMGIALVALISVAAILGGVCGTGHCSNSGIDDVKRQQGIVELISNLANVEYPNDDTDTKTPEQEALLFVAENDPLKLSADKDSARIVQRYGLATMWFANGPWAKAAVPASAWFAAPDECQWEGILCDASGTVVSIALDDRSLSGELPNDLSLLTALTELDLSFNQLEGSIQDALDILTALESNLQVLDLESNKFGGPLTDDIAAFTSLKELHLGNNKLQGSLPERLSSMTQLKLFSVSGNLRLAGTIPSSLGSLTALTWLGLGQCAFTGAIPDIFDQMTDLEVLQLGGTAHSDGTQSLAALDGLSKLKELEYYTDVSETTLPSEVAEWWPSLEKIALQDIGLGGQLPSSIAQWTSLRTFVASRNSFTGTLPAEVFPAWADTIEQVNVAWNTMGGSILDNLGLWTKLQTFDVRNNDFSGTIPTTVGALTQMENFYLSGNRFSGELPVELLNFSEWSDSKLENNDFTGVAPFCLEQSFLVTATVDCAEVSCTCCTTCI